MNLSTMLHDRAVKHEVYLERMTKTEAKALVKELRLAMKEIVGKLAVVTDRNLQSWLKRAEKAIGALMEEATDAGTTRLRHVADRLVAYDAGLLAKDINSFRIAVDLTMPSASDMRTMLTMRPTGNGDTVDEMLKAYGRSRVAAAIRAVRIGKMQGENVQELTQRLLGTKEFAWQDGELARAARSAEGLVRTVVMHASNMGREALYQANSDIITGIQIVATLDGATCEECGVYDGQVFPVDEGPRPPFHQNCRCTTIPVLKSYRELGLDVDEVPAGTRAAMDGYESSKTTYREWFDRQDPAFQKSVLGPGRYALYGKGVALTDMVDGGRLLTLDELEKRGL